MPVAFGFWISFSICLSLMIGFGLPAYSSLPLDNVPLSLQVNPGLHSPENFTPPPDVLLNDSLNEPEQIPLLSWADYYGKQNLLQPRNMEPLPLSPTQPPWWLLMVLSLSLVGFAYARLNYPYKTKLFFLAVASARHFNQLEREGGFFKETATWLFFGVFILSFAALIYETIIQYPILNFLHYFSDYMVFIIIVGGVITFFVYKGLINAYLAWVFQTRQAKTAYSTNVFLFNNLVGLILLPIVAVNLYNPSEVLIITGWVIFFILNIIKFIKGVMVGSVRSKYSWYYFLLYLCIVEIIPLLLIARLAGFDVFPG